MIRVDLEPLGLHHLDGLRAAAWDGELWNLHDRLARHAA
jgi:hypothetical protein